MALPPNPPPDLSADRPTSPTPHSASSPDPSAPTLASAPTEPLSTEPTPTAPPPTEATPTEANPTGPSSSWPVAVWTPGPSLGLGLALLLAYLLLQAAAMVVLAVVELALAGQAAAEWQGHLQSRMGGLFSVSTLLAAPSVSLLAWIWTMAGARRRFAEGHGAPRGPGSPGEPLAGATPPLPPVHATLRGRSATARRLARRHLGLVPPGWRGILLWTVVTAALMAGYEAAAVALDRPPLPDFIVQFYGTGSPWLLAAAVVLGAPLAEEVVFRGFLLPGLAAGPLGRAGGVLLTALLWAVIHGQYDPFDMTAVFALGVAFGAARLHTGSLAVPLLLHAAVNALAMVQVFATLG